MRAARTYLFQDLPHHVVVITREGEIVGERFVQWNGEGLDVLLVPDAELAANDAGREQE